MNATIMLEQLLARLKDSQRDGEFSIARLYNFASQLLTYVHSNRGAARSSTMESAIGLGFALPPLWPSRR
ncbi:hypothetical protein [Mesorhizobium carmichaelinearum]|uniref:hypothetical protein n=1 Tax=Mesorhizobium carmichaelinearum TaxID=1208188 RepID=UPI000BA46DE0